MPGRVVEDDPADAAIFLEKHLGGNEGLVEHGGSRSWRFCSVNLTPLWQIAWIGASAQSACLAPRA
jgi:hypothetical protein